MSVRRKIVYIVSAMHYPNGMAKILTEKLNWLALHTDYELYMVETERADLPHHYVLDNRIECVNFDINFDAIYKMPSWKRVWYTLKCKKIFKDRLTNYLLSLKPDITITTMRREIDFINDIKDGSKKIGEIHFSRDFYRVYNNKKLPAFVNKTITYIWQKKLIKEIKRLDKFVVLTHEDKKKWAELNNVCLIPNFIQSIPAEQTNFSQKKVIALGRYSYQKGFDLLIKAWQKVESHIDEWQLDVYGSGDREAYQKLADEHLLKRMFMHEAINNVEDVYKNASLYVLSSRNEGLPMVLIEAMSYGIPCVSFCCPSGPMDIITDSEDGLLVKNGDWEALADGIEKIIQDKALRISLGKKARIKVQNYLCDNVMPQWVEIFENTLTR